MEIEKKFIIEALKVFLGKSDRSALNKLYKYIDIKSLEKLVSQYGIAGIFFNMYIEKIFNGIILPLDFIDFLKRSAGKNSLINSIFESEIIRLTKRLKENNIDYFYMKGASTRKRCFDNDYATKSADIDFFIKHKDYGKVKEILISEGYEVPMNYYNKVVDYTTFYEFEKKEGEICFTRKEGTFEYIVDLQWDLINHDKTDIFHSIYDLEKFYDFDKKDFILFGSEKVDVFPIELEFVNMSFHYAFHRGFNGIKWFVELCLFIKRYGEIINFEYILSKADNNSKKILGIILKLVYNFNCDKKLERNKDKLFCIDRMLPFEYMIYKNMTTKVMDIKTWIRALKLVKILLPYSKLDGFNIIKENIFFSFKKINK